MASRFLLLAIVALLCVSVVAGDHLKKIPKIFKGHDVDYSEFFKKLTKEIRANAKTVDMSIEGRISYSTVDFAKVDSLKQVDIVLYDIERREERCRISNRLNGMTRLPTKYRINCSRLESESDSAFGVFVALYTEEPRTNAKGEAVLSACDYQTNDVHRSENGGKANVVLSRVDPEECSLSVV